MVETVERTYTVYSFDELSERAQESIRDSDWYHIWAWDVISYWWGDGDNNGDDADYRNELANEAGYTIDKLYYTSYPLEVNTVGTFDLEKFVKSQKLKLPILTARRKDEYGNWYTLLDAYCGVTTHEISRDGAVEYVWGDTVWYVDDAQYGVPMSASSRARSTEELETLLDAVNTWHSDFDRKLARMLEAEEKSMFEAEYMADTFDGNDIKFLEDGTRF